LVDASKTSFFSYQTRCTWREPGNIWPLTGTALDLEL
jgi:hypothetical protein